MTTNGLVLSKKLEKFQKAGLNALNISLDTLDPAKFIQITRRKGFEKVMESITVAQQLDIESLKLNCVVMKGFNENEISDFVNLTKNEKLQVRFIEYMPFDGNQWNDKKFFSYKQMIEIIKQSYPSFNKVPFYSGLSNETAKIWKVPDFKGSVGFITSMTV